jgi:hypothetical protein
VTTQAWIGLSVAIAAALGIGVFIFLRTRWWRIRKYALDLKRTFDKHKIQDKMQALQQLQAQGVTDPTRARKPLRDVVESYRAMLTDLEKVKAPPVATEVHQEALTMHREALQFYQIMSTGTFQQKEMRRRQEKLQRMERSVQAKMETLFGKPK